MKSTDVTQGAPVPAQQSVRMAWELAAMFAAPVRWVTGWLFLSAFIRRFINSPEKMSPDAAGYVGEKFNHFMPHAVAGQKEMIEWLLGHPTQLHLFLVVFSILEGLCGLGLLTGTLTRLSALGIGLMSYGVLTGAGWIGSTCLDEWQIGSLGMAGALVVMGTGAGRFSLDHPVMNRFRKPWLKWLASGPLFEGTQSPRRFSWAYTGGAAVVVLIMLVTYQAFFSGLWGRLHNHSVRPEIQVSQVRADSGPGTLSFRVYRTGGPDTYGAFLVRVRLKDEHGTVVGEAGAEQLAGLDPESIRNEYLVQVRSMGNALLVPLGGAAVVKMLLPHTGKAAVLELEDVSGLKFEARIS